MSSKINFLLLLLLMAMAQCMVACGESSQPIARMEATHVDLPPAWTGTPPLVATPTASPSPPPRPVNANRPTENDIESIASIWEAYGLADGLDLLEPGAREFSINHSSGRPLIWPFYWCATNHETMVDNLTSITVMFMINQSEVVPDEILQFERASQDWSCHYWATLLRQWQGESPIKLTIQYTLAQAVFDGKEHYPAGKYALELTASASTSSVDSDYAGPNFIFYLQDAGLQAELGDGAMLFMIRPDGSGMRQVAEGFYFAVSPDVSMVAYRHGVTVGGPDEVRVVDLAQGKVILRVAIPGFCDGFWVLSGFDWSPDSRRITYTLAQSGLEGFDDACTRSGAVAQVREDAGVYQIDVMTGSVWHFPMSVTYEAPIYKREGSILYLPVSRIALDSETGDRVEVASAYDADEFCPGELRVAPCGAEVSYSDGPNICLVDISGREVARVTNYAHYPEARPSPSQEIVQSEAVNSFTVLPDCSRIVYQTHRKVFAPLTPDPQEGPRSFFQPIYIVDMDGNNDQLIMEDAIDYVLTPDGLKIVIMYKEYRATVREIAIADIDGTNLQPIEVPFPWNAAASPRGDAIAIAGDGIFIINTDGSDLRKIAGGGGLEILEWR